MKKTIWLILLSTVACVSNNTKVDVKPSIMVSALPSVIITSATPILTPIPQVSQVAGSPSPTPIIRHTIYATIHTPTPSPLPTSIYPSGVDVGGSYDIVDNVLLAGFVYDENGKIVEKAKVSIEFIDLTQDLYGVATDIETDSNGEYFFGGFRSGTKVKIKVSKDGYQDVVRVEILKVNDYIDPKERYINFGGTVNDAKYALKKIKTP